MAGGHGGKRPGAGRRPGGANKLTKRAAADLEAARATGADTTSALEIMSATMRALWRAANQGKDGKAVALDIAKAREAHAIAKDVAPYMHPKLQSIEGVLDKPLVVRDEVSVFERARRVAFLMVAGARAAPGTPKRPAPKAAKPRKVAQHA